MLLGTQEIEFPEAEERTAGEHAEMVKEKQDPLFKNEAAKSVLKQIKNPREDKD